ncbi:4-amino-4-deoxychorismate lyase [Lihuaxuella thermophila]|uniref:4-amino-4-deoxychorismate lyase n=2 Tax=Lihuaxuella thermophila TaxID=1173111 RepID=A0A1H8I4H2_9BACL|nr:4-amino-4-deoxychorismate lyase [Lihuaxuella thermophila]
MAIMMLNGCLVREEEAVVSVFDHGLLYGVGAFETLRLYEGHPFLLDDHLNRLNEGLKRMSVRPPYTTREWERQIGELTERNHLQNASVRITVTGGAEGLGLTASSYERPSTMIFIRPLPFEPGELFHKGKRLQVVSVPRQAPGGVEKYKTSNYLNSVLARQEVEDFPQTEGVMLTPDGALAEGIVSNLFFVSGGVLHTPSLESGILAGVTRHWVMELAGYLGFRVKEGRYTLEDLQQADEIFVTNSVQEMVPVYEFSGKPKRNPVITQRLYEAYQTFTTRLRSAGELRGRKLKQ